ncbi:RagB/SusD family nutrient uptake outer membrane protein [Proteiniphilum sp.]|uniref:RagB/SusD family nutrient uptake outer membrane protein n=1 Tax=Proteiniphilum sp. TaxID=1926877 RepID=UPI00331BD6C3
MKSKIIAISLIISLSTILTKCDYLDIIPDNTIEVGSLFENRDKALSALSTCYSYMPNFEKLHESMSLAGDEWLGRLDADHGESRSLQRGMQLMRGWNNSNDPILNYWGNGGGATGLYRGIRVCNVFFENIDNVPDLTSAERNDWVAQVKILKAYYHYYLLRLYGPIVIADKNLEPFSSVDEVRQERQTVDSCFNYVLNLIDEALVGGTGSDLFVERENAYYGQIDQINARAIKAQILITRASPLFNGNSEYFSNFTNKEGQTYFPMQYDPEKWKQALDGIKEAIDFAENRGKKLYTFEGQPKFWDVDNFEKSEIIQYAYNKRFAIVDGWNDELLWGYSGLDYEGQGGFAHATNMRSVADPTQAGYAWQWLGADYRMTELYHTKNGVPIDEDKTFEYDNRLQITEIPDDNYHKGYMQAGQRTIKLHLNREPRFYAWMVVDRCIWRTHDLANDVKMRYNEFPGGRGSQHTTDFYWTGIGVKKMVHPESGTGHWARVVKFPYPIIRLSDLYLMYAEAYNEYHGPGAPAYDYLNRVRATSGLKPVEEVWSDGNIVRTVDKHLTKEGLRDIIQRERLIELSFEGHRYFDILRWKQADRYFLSPVRGWNTTGVDPEQFYVLTTLQPRRWQTPRDYLMPIPISDLNRNPNLKQNPGW